MQRELRRKDRAVDREQAWRILEQGEYGVLSTVSPEGQPYGTPLHYCLMDGDIYFHCALTGHKLDNIAANSRVSLCVVGKAQVLPDQFATLYESVVAFGPATEVLGAQKQAALNALLDKYSLDFRAEGLKYIEKMSGKARVFKIAIEALSGKARTA
ncbi:MAG: pyridoxamine 5'-phosphate oxidase family protein [Desulfarculaceae bacterium]|nr:pyridoxamine 5'-phosphate oxidase family protein [Desulfarculaceae bacterium]MCF8049582.1 pyridoxamine 5'-phosphate oxidase family protein [Desulfarculaceae bacterium]MCF8063916.1 pyridoxamine 5'-phosphate oxidase family protein [Desulfarculaceae bacterium]MCF8097122.1 pyridoxamine 5'-phosphate oxidase family protein [Desulfarculaceae bacterium]MCF8122691.1 pyridoxamine 5'-phosphate oxidase family protein [Desulfarculaceae bacterium]